MQCKSWSINEHKNEVNFRVNDVYFLQNYDEPAINLRKKLSEFAYNFSKLQEKFINVLNTSKFLHRRAYSFKYVEANCINIHQSLGVHVQKT